MIEETFGLTQITEKSRYNLPALPSPSSYSLRKSVNSARFSDDSNPLLQKSTSALLKVTDRLRDVQGDVKRSFDTLYTTRRVMLLPKAMELERSDSVKDQMRTLENYVVSLLKMYNELQNQHRSKDTLLSNLTKELDRINNREPDLAPIKSAAEDVKHRYEFALRQFDRETDYTEVLDHMIMEMHKAITKKVQPIYSLRKDLQQMKLRFHESEVDYLRVSLESKSMWNMIKKNEEELRQQIAHHGYRVQEKVMHFRRRAEFVEFFKRQGEQKLLEEQIKDNERDTRRMETSKRSAERIEQMLESAKSHLEALQNYERQSEILSRAAHTGNIQQVIEYWQYLQDFQGNLSSKVDIGAERVAEIRAEFKFLCEERTAVLLRLAPDDGISNEELERMRAMLERKEREVLDMMVKLNVWRQAVANIRGRLEGVWMMIGGELVEMTLGDLMRRIEEELVARLPRQD